jgi:hypothetical protein
MTSRYAAAALAAALSTLSLTVGLPSAAAAPSCYGGAKAWKSVNYRENVGTYTTTSRCHDINVKTDWEGVQACVVFVDHTDECNRLTWTPPGKWTVVASDVRDGTRFELRIIYFEVPERDGLVAF